MAQLLDPALIEREGTTAPISEIARFLSDHLGAQATAYVAGVKGAAQVAKWIEGGTPPKGQMTRLRLRDAYRAARLLVTAYDEATAEAWFFGSNSRLDDEAPAWVLRHARSLDDLRMVVPAAKAFARARA
ncbi:XRE family transcriptional regulator [Solirubrobacter sp. CPCC 204708]|uniref:XRE family transcriptional regulator n=1 Tax=Solirubrobacter deserti TaxID=2282478 RepID=A0ABT4RP22_9ACTN|nr:hypothetical protein [Solirubrobacter deserti]MBE2317510.1 XRE family transcriptional regulator [Solirubrobacter deserti]MDA0140314.1 hypothetical protein [Solirubrobacter deserti]